MLSFLASDNLPPEAGCFLATESKSQSDANFPDRGGLMWELGINSK